MAESNETASNEKTKAPAAKGGSKAPPSGELETTELGVKATTKPRRPKMPTGKFVAKMNLDVWNPEAKLNPETKKWEGARVQIPEGSVVPEYVDEAQLATFQENGAIDHEYK